MKQFAARNRTLLIVAMVLLTVWLIEKIFSIELLSRDGFLLMYAYALYGDIRDRIDNLERSLYEY